MIVLRNFKDSNFVDDKLTAKQQNLRPSKICTYTVFRGGDIKVFQIFKTCISNITVTDIVNDISIYLEYF